MNIPPMQGLTSGFTRVSPLVWYVSAVLLVTIDIMSRIICFSYCNVTFGRYLGLHPFRNQYFAFSIPLPTWSMYMLYGVVLVVLISYIVRQWMVFSVYQKSAWFLILAGSLANVGERVMNGYVRDFIQIGTGYLNMGDVYILMGVAYLLYSNLVHTK